jgi:hypothetical protein
MPGFLVAKIGLEFSSDPAAIYAAEEFFNICPNEVLCTCMVFQRFYMSPIA